MITTAAAAVVPRFGNVRVSLRRTPTDGERGQLMVARFVDGEYCVVTQRTVFGSFSGDRGDELSGRARAFYIIEPHSERRR